MKRILLVLAGITEYEDVQPQGNGVKWKFYDKDGVKADGAILECILINKKRLSSTKKVGEQYDLYEVMHRITKKPYVIFCNKVLEDRLKVIPLNSAVRIEWKGIAPGKQYHLYAVGFDRSFKFNPDEWQAPKDYVETNPETQPGDFKAPAAGTTGTKADDFEDAPF